MKNNAIARIIINCIIIVVLLNILALGLHYRGSLFKGFHFSDNSNSGTDVNTTSITDVDALDIDWVTGSIRLVPGSQDVITVEEHKGEKAPEMVVKKNGSTLKVEFSDSKLKLNQAGSKDLTITVPENWVCRSLDIDCAATKVYAENLTLDRVDLDTASGECSFTNCHVGTIDMDSASGDLFFSGTLDALEFDAASANAELVLTNTPREINVDSMSGNVTLTLPENSGFTVTRESLGGTFDCEFTTTNNGKRVICGDGSCRIEMDGMSSSLHILKSK